MARRLIKILIWFFKLNYNYIIIWTRKFNRFFGRFFNRLFQFWYIGIVLIVIYGVLTFLLLKINVINNVMTFFPGYINTLLTIFLIDFLRSESERKRNVNKKYLFHTELLGVNVKIRLLLSNVFNIDDESNLTEENIEYIIEQEYNFWSQDTNVFNKEISREDYFLMIIKELKDESRHLISAYMSQLEYKEYRLLFLLKDICAEDELTDRMYTSYNIMRMVELMKLIESIFGYWEKDNPIQYEIYKYKRLIRENVS
ncbi:hypothetical protein BED47_00820 [Gottfriedia luciferensis]|uniref:Uncharacterized protein n=1 Tax=Gottfriedia luciferensis TaxID=178774 RepID=A0ABX2ZZF2_9BACI|nr:hypothetical protein [Gottfriedia luciferensis]ODG93744.1 hypothetical protein BED47_00820 [Gottfriedia luciferensis]